MTPGPESVGGGSESAGPAETESAPGYPVILSLAGRPALVVGGGPVAARRARGLVEAGARVTVVALRPSPELDELAAMGTMAIETRAYRHGEAATYALVVTATGDRSVDDSVIADATSAGVLVSCADGDRPGTVQLPAVVRRGPVTVAVATGGASPALAKWLSDRIDGMLSPRLAIVVALVEEARTSLRDSGRPTASVDWADLLDTVVVPLVEADRIEEARTALRRAVEHPGGGHLPETTGDRDGPSVR
jgi:siroheme synthase-like protein